jgi:rhamnogalacturonan endolyase
VPRLVSTWNVGAVNASQSVQPTFHGDILGDWREEAVYTNAALNELIIFTTNQPAPASRIPPGREITLSASLRAARRR